MKTLKKALKDVIDNTKSNTHRINMNMELIIVQEKFFWMKKEDLYIETTM